MRTTDACIFSSFVAICVSNKQKQKEIHLKCPSQPPRPSREENIRHLESILKNSASKIFVRNLFVKKAFLLSTRPAALDHYAAFCAADAVLDTKQKYRRILEHESQSFIATINSHIRNRNSLKNCKISRSNRRNL